MALNTYLIRSTIVGALGGLLFGFDTAVISGTTRAVDAGIRADSAHAGGNGRDCAAGDDTGAATSRGDWAEDWADARRCASWRCCM
jgi:SP family arabinose:H+ symporter-like MFS transporter